MGDGRGGVLCVGFEPRLRLAFQGAEITSDAGLLVYRELDEAANLTESSADDLFDFRIGRNICHSTLALPAASVGLQPSGGVRGCQRCGRLGPVMRQVVGGRARNKQAASASQIARFETKVLAEMGNLESRMNLPGQWVDQVRGRKPIKRLILDMDSSVSPTHGDQEDSAYIRLSRAFSCSSSLTRLSIDASIPPYLLHHL